MAVHGAANIFPVPGYEPRASVEALVNEKQVKIIVIFFTELQSYEDHTKVKTVLIILNFTKKNYYGKTNICHQIVEPLYSLYLS